ncbi:unnamed protein product [Allacma fusca]|uniref:Uncharacterized protein n=1 Tax=Allacma fusca TaxID=39272 RepID=A0A8J2L3W6_9HEXA|nr:unnamed protein product [Allacma fusca]
MTEEEIIGEARKKIPSKFAAIACTSAKTTEELTTNLEGLLYDPEYNPNQKFTVAPSVSQASQLQDNSIRTLTTGIQCDYCLRNNHVMKHCADMRRDLSKGNISRLDELFEGRPRRGFSMGNTNNNNLSSGLTNFDVRQGQQSLLPQNQSLEQQQFQQFSQTSQQQFQQSEIQTFVPDQQPFILQNQNSENRAETTRSNPQPAWMNQTVVPRNPQQVNLQEPQQFLQNPQQPPHQQVIWVPQTKILDLNLQSEIKYKYVSNENSKLNRQNYPKSNEVHSRIPTPIRRASKEIPENVKKKEKTKEDIPRKSSVIEYQEKSQTSIPQYHSGKHVALRFMTEPESTTNKEYSIAESEEETSTYEQNMGQEFLRLLSQTYRKDQDVYCLKIASYPVDIRAVVDSGAAISTMSAAAVYYLQKCCPRSIQVLDHEPRPLERILPGSGGTYNKSATLYFQINEISTPHNYTFCIIEDMNTLMLLGHNFNHRFGILMDATKNSITYQGRQTLLNDQFKNNDSGECELDVNSDSSCWDLDRPLTESTTSILNSIRFIQRMNQEEPKSLKKDITTKSAIELNSEFPREENSRILSKQTAVGEESHCRKNVRFSHSSIKPKLSSSFTFSPLHLSSDRPRSPKKLVSAEIDNTEKNHLEIFDVSSEVPALYEVKIPTPWINSDESRSQEVDFISFKDEAEYSQSMEFNVPSPHNLNPLLESITDQPRGQIENLINILGSKSDFKVNLLDTFAVSSEVPTPHEVKIPSPGINSDESRSQEVDLISFETEVEHDRSIEINVPPPHKFNPLPDPNIDQPRGQEENLIRLEGNPNVDILSVSNTEETLQSPSKASQSGTSLDITRDGKYFYNHTSPHNLLPNDHFQLSEYDDVGRMNSGLREVEPGKAMLTQHEQFQVLSVLEDCRSKPSLRTRENSVARSFQDASGGGDRPRNKSLGKPRILTTYHEDYFRFEKKTRCSPYRLGRTEDGESDTLPESSIRLASSRNLVSLTRKQWREANRETEDVKNSPPRNYPKRQYVGGSIIFYNSNFSPGVHGSSSIFPHLDVHPRTSRPTASSVASRAYSSMTEVIESRKGRRTQTQTVFYRSKDLRVKVPHEQKR